VSHGSSLAGDTLRNAPSLASTSKKATTITSKTTALSIPMGLEGCEYKNDDGMRVEKSALERKLSMWGSTHDYLGGPRADWLVYTTSRYTYYRAASRRRPHTSANTPTVRVQRLFRACCDCHFTLGNADNCLRFNQHGRYSIGVRLLCTFIHYILLCNDISGLAVCVPAFRSTFYLC
jgi:hypothetical protein